MKSLRAYEGLGEVQSQWAFNTPSDPALIGGGGGESLYCFTQAFCSMWTEPLSGHKTGGCFGCLVCVSQSSISFMASTQLSHEDYKEKCCHFTVSDVVAEG